MAVMQKTCYLAYLKDSDDIVRTLWFCGYQFACVFTYAKTFNKSVLICFISGNRCKKEPSKCMRNNACSEWTVDPLLGSVSSVNKVSQYTC